MPLFQYLPLGVGYERLRQIQRRTAVSSALLIHALSRISEVLHVYVLLNGVSTLQLVIQG